ncbi:MAG TPA: LysR family transcriptional regulator [Opitutaceae bacterium]|nr:LysR family transcriptional regulator [Opitutaceae bacterium]
MPKAKETLRPRLRFPEESSIAFGPGKAELLGHIIETGSIAKSAARMSMSYNRAWGLVRDMNALFKKPLVTRERGGSKGGGSEVTEAGRDVLRRYLRMESDCLRATRADWRAIRSLLRA